MITLNQAYSMEGPGEEFEESFHYSPLGFINAFFHGDDAEDLRSRHFFRDVRRAFRRETT